MNEIAILDSIKNPSDLKNLPREDLPKLAEEIRQIIIHQVAKSGGHLASNLGIVELTLALHTVYDQPKDKIIWDVGHQTYAHKLLTERSDRFDTLRQFCGISGFPKIEESPYDCFGTGHSSTSISAALGFAKARDLKGEDEHVIAVIGDGALTGGLAWEALNNAGHQNTRLIVILNDNEMSITQNVGALPTHLSKLKIRPGYRKFENKAKEVLQHLPVGSRTITRTAEGIMHGVTHLMAAQAGIIFEEMGFTYLGPIDGHNIDLLIQMLESVKEINKPVFVHILTTKGKGYEHAENKPWVFHGTPPFEIGNGLTEKNGKPTFSAAFSEEIVELAEKNEKITAITAAMLDGSGLQEFSQLFPERFFDVGIAESHAVTFAAGLAAAGLRPVVSIYSTFLQRAYDQIVHDVCLQNLPVVFAVGNAGLVGEDGPTHHGVFDLSYLRHIPNMVIASPSCGGELKQMLRLAFEQSSPFAIRFPRGFCPGEVPNATETPVSLGKAEKIADGDDVCIIALGCAVYAAASARETLAEKGISAGVINARFVKPLDSELIKEAAQKTHRLVVVEENAVIGGLGSAVAELLAESGIEGIKIKLLGIPDSFVQHGACTALREKCSLDSTHIAQAAEELGRRVTHKV